MDLLSKGPKTPDEIARRLKISWAAAQANLLKLAGEGKIRLTRKGRVNVFYRLTCGRLTFNVPPWIRPMNLRKLTERLDEYFPEGVSAAEIVERERRKF
ncbi:MAG: winged helix-turn-helix domain-containing protein [Candidatus Bathyarchaeia archaeon]